LVPASIVKNSANGKDLLFTDFHSFLSYKLIYGKIIRVATKKESRQLAAKKASRTTTRKVKDKWRSKEWYRVLAPDMFNKTQIADTLSDDKEKVIGRVTEVTMQDLTGDFSKMHIKLMFRIDEVNGFDAHTQFIGHSLTSDYIRRLTRRKHSKTDGVFDVLTAENNLHAEFVREMLLGNISKNILKACKPIYPLKRVEIRKSEVIRLPTEKVVEAPSEEKISEEKIEEKEELVAKEEEPKATVEEEIPKEGEVSEKLKEVTQEGEEPKE